MNHEDCKQDVDEVHAEFTALVAKLKDSIIDGKDVGCLDVAFEHFDFEMSALCERYDSDWLDYYNPEDGFTYAGLDSTELDDVYHRYRELRAILNEKFITHDYFNNRLFNVMINLGIDHDQFEKCLDKLREFNFPYCLWENAVLERVIDNLEHISQFAFPSEDLYGRYD